MAADLEQERLHAAGQPALDAIAVLNEGVAFFDANADLTFANPSFHRMNSAVTEFLEPGTRWDIFLREAAHRGAIPDDLCRQLQNIESDLLDGPVEARTVQLKSDQGETYSIQLSPTSDGGFVLTQSPAVDQSGEIDAAREAEILLSKVLEASTTCVTMSRIGDGQVIYRSPAATALLGPAKSSFSHFAKREERADFVTALLPDARVDDMRVTGIRAGGEEFPAGISARLIDYHGEEVVVSNMEDLTDELAIQAELARQRERLFQTEKMSALGELLAGVAHELNNPLSIIMGNTEILKEDLAGSNQESRIEKLGNAAERCIRIVRSFLSMARQEPLNLESVAVNDLVDTALDALTSVTAGTNIQIKVSLPDGIPDIIADEVQIAQVLINLLTNSVHAIQGSGMGDTIEVSARCGVESNTVSLVVSDNGPGVDDDIKGRIFDPLFTTKEVGMGTGVGLAFSHRIVAAHNGTIQLDPSKSRGAVFSIQLPAVAT